MNENLTLLDIETQNWNVRSNTKQVKKKIYLEPDAFSEK